MVDSEYLTNSVAKKYIGSEIKNSELNSNMSDKDVSWQLFCNDNKVSSEYNTEFVQEAKPEAITEKEPAEQKHENPEDVNHGAISTSINDVVPCKIDLNINERQESKVVEKSHNPNI